MRRCYTGGPRPHRNQGRAKRRMTTATESFDVIIIGAGAAGLMCALTAGQRGRKVLLLDHADKVGAKILISGGGRCNFTNLHSAPDRFLSGNPDFCRSALGRYTQADFIALVERHGIPYHEKTLGQLFCDGSARAIVAMLLAECAQGSVDLRVGHTVTDISHADSFRVETAQRCFTAPAVVLATGGLSIPKMGATGFAYDVARRFGLNIIEPQPGLVPLKATPEALGFSQLLAGVSLEAIASCAANELPRKHPVHAPRPLWSGHPSNLVLLAAGGYDCARPRAGLRRERFSFGAQALTSQGGSEDRARRDLARPPRARAGRSMLAAWADGQYPRPHPRGLCGAPQTLGDSTGGLGRVAESRGDGRGYRYPRPVVQDDGSAQRPRPLCHR